MGSPATAFRITLLVLCSVLSAVASDRTYAAVPIALLSAFTVAAERLPALRREPVPAVCGEAAFTGLTVALTGVAGSPMLPYLLAPGLALGLRRGPGHVLAATAAACVGLVLGALVLPVSSLQPGASTAVDLVVDVGLWVLLGLAFGLVAGWAQRLTVATEPASVDRYLEARRLLEQLRGVTRRLPGGLDLTSSAEALLEQCSVVACTQRSAVLVQTGPGALVPAAVRGTTRVPWRTPLSDPGPLRTAWSEGRTVVDRRTPDVDGRRRGSTLVVIPLTTGEQPFGLLVLETLEVDGFPTAAVEGCVELAADAALRLETALLFDEVRSTVSIEERDRLAREMHDGVAQELAFVGYQLDDLKIAAGRLDPDLAGRVTEVRTGLTRLISDIRLSITDLRTSLSNDRGLGAVLSGYVRAIGSGSRVAVHVTLQESPFRLPSDTEVLLFQVAQAVAQDVRRTGRAENLWVSLTVDPPSARLRVEHDGPVEDLRDLDLEDYAEQLSRSGGDLRVDARDGGGVCVTVELEGSHERRSPARR